MCDGCCSWDPFFCVWNFLQLINRELNNPYSSHQKRDRELFDSKLLFQSKSHTEQIMQTESSSSLTKWNRNLNNLVQSNHHSWNDSETRRRKRSWVTGTHQTRSKSIQMVSQSKWSLNGGHGNHYSRYLTPLENRQIQFAWAGDITYPQCDRLDQPLTDGTHLTEKKKRTPPNRLYKVPQNAYRDSQISYTRQWLTI